MITARGRLLVRRMHIKGLKVNLCGDLGRGALSLYSPSAQLQSRNTSSKGALTHV